MTNKSVSGYAYFEGFKPLSLARLLTKIKTSYPKRIRKRLAQFNEQDYRQFLRSSGKELR